MVSDILERNIEVAKVLETKLDLDSQVVGIKVVKNESEIPSNIGEIPDSSRHCQLAKMASNGGCFYAPLEKQSCKGGAAALGLTDLPEKIESGEFYVNLGRFKDTDSAKATLGELPSLENENYALIYAPLTKADFEADVILIFLKPVQAMKVSQALVYDDFSRVGVDFAGIQSLCADAVARPMNSNGVNITLGCDGSRKYAKLDDDELVVGVSSSKVDLLVNSLNMVIKE